MVLGLLEGESRDGDGEAVDKAAASPRRGRGGPSGQPRPEFTREHSYSKSSAPSDLPPAHFKVWRVNVCLDLQPRLHPCHLQTRRQATAHTSCPSSGRSEVGLRVQPRLSRCGSGGHRRPRQHPWRWSRRHHPTLWAELRPNRGPQLVPRPRRSWTRGLEWPQEATPRSTAQCAPTGPRRDAGLIPISQEAK